MLKKSRNFVIKKGNLLESTTESEYNPLEIITIDKLKEYTDSILARLRLIKRRKISPSPQYPFDTIDHNDIPNITARLQNGLKRFYLIGNNWLEDSNQKPIALLIGFNYWKRGFISDYLPEYRCAFTPTKIRFPGRLIFRLLKTRFHPSVFVVWGYQEPRLMRWYAKLRKIPICRVEDGFIRSADLGLSHCTPYSLIFDKRGLHYNAKIPSDIENLLNNYDFDSDVTLLKEAEEALDIVLSLNISKYNLPCLVKNLTFPISFQKKVLVIGQVPHDMSLKLGNPNNWDIEKLLTLAKIENPTAEIVYRPHPDNDYRGRKNSLKTDKFLPFVNVIEPDIPLSAILQKVDHVYTITSLVGFEAILRGIKVTVVGTPFYAGWGLTNDKIKFPQRNRKVTKIQLFAIACLKYPRYLANLENPYIGLVAACLRINADREVLYSNTVSKIAITSVDQIKVIARSENWPKLFFGIVNNQSYTREELVKIAYQYIDFVNFIRKIHNKLAQSTIIYAICGVLEDEAILNRFITDIRSVLEIEVLNSLLCDLAKYRPGNYLIQHISWLLAKNQERDMSFNILYSHLKKLEKEFLDTVGGGGSNHESFSEKNLEVKNQLKATLLQMFNRCLEDFHINDAIRYSHLLLLNGNTSPDLFAKIARLAELKFDRSSAFTISTFARLINVNINVNIDINVYNSNTDQTLTLLKNLALNIRINSVHITSCTFSIQQIFNRIESNKWVNVFESILLLDNNQDLKKATAYIVIGKYTKAIKILEKLIEANNKPDIVDVWYAQALSYNGELQKALEVIRMSKENLETTAKIREHLRLCILQGDYYTGLKLLEQATAKRFDVGEMLERKIYLGNRKIKEAFEAYTRIKIAKILQACYKNKYYLGNESDLKNKKFLLLNTFGPGDEIRFASIYNLIRKNLQCPNISICCDARLYTLFCSSFPELNFIPTSRVRKGEKYEINKYDKLPNSELCLVIDNNGVCAIDEADRIALVSDMLPKCLENDQSFPGVPYLQANKDKVALYQKELNKYKNKLVGISWRSSLTTYSRVEHYLTIQEIEPIFQINNIQFVNFQYDECEEELKWVEERYPNKIINFAEIDQYNDFDSVAALMSCMDLIIAPATTVVELAGALGCNTWLLSNSSELYWRKINREKTDIWHKNVTHVEGEILGNKASLVKELVKKLEEYSLIEC